MNTIQRGKIDIVSDSKIPIDGSNATLRMSAAVFKEGSPKLFKYSVESRQLCGIGRLYKL